MMDIEKMIEQLRYLADTPSYTAFHDAKEREIICDQCEADFCYDKQQDAHWCMYEVLSRADTALSTLQAENAQLRVDLEYEREHANAYYEECGQWEAENEKLRAELEKVKAERDGAIADIAAILAEVEEIRRGYGVDNADADDAFADLCGNYCSKCGNNCYEETEDYRCKNFKWRGIKEG